MAPGRFSESSVLSKRTSVLLWCSRIRSVLRRRRHARSGFLTACVLPILALTPDNVAMAQAGFADPKALTYELNGVRLHIPQPWTVTALDDYRSRRGAQLGGVSGVIPVQRSIIIGFPYLPDDPRWREHYPEITPPFVYELVLSPVNQLEALSTARKWTSARSTDREGPC